MRLSSLVEKSRSVDHTSWCSQFCFVSYIDYVLYIDILLQVLSNEEHIFTQCGNKVCVLEVASGQVSHEISQEEDPEVTCFVVSPDDKVVENFLISLLMFHIILSSIVFNDS